MEKEQQTLPLKVKEGQVGVYMVLVKDGHYYMVSDEEHDATEIDTVDIEMCRTMLKKICGQSKTSE